MMRLKQPVITNSAGKPIVLTEQEKYSCMIAQKKVNEAAVIFSKMYNSPLGFEIPITTLTTIVKKVSEQKFFEIPPADYLPVRVGEGAWSDFLTTYRSFDIGADFETGILNAGSQSARLARADAGVDALTISVFNWGKEIDWTIIELAQAARSGNWDLVSTKEEARKKNWDLGIQRVAFLGARGQNGQGGNCLGLLNQGTSVTTNTSVITKALKSMSPAELKTLTSSLVSTYRANCNYTAWPTHFHIPESDFTGLGSPSSSEFPISSTLKLLTDMFKEIIPYNKFKGILPIAYADAANHADVTAIAGKQVYTLMNYDEKSIRMDIPVDYTNTLANSVNNFSFQNAGYGQFTGVLAYRPLEMMYFTYAA